jgi:hypothetical protein
VAKGRGGIEGKAVKIATDTVARLLACLLLTACTSVTPGSPPTVELDKRYETLAAPTATLTPEEKIRVQNWLLSPPSQICDT